ncbi:hypothetical protein OG361_03770 [Streptomyces sp. NBC_00090]|uniref:hypothetical protein n=1 Tax=Streptomyces sp. NBC_00090 TaxID=2903619 RepID=UPI0032439D87
MSPRTASTPPARGPSSSADQWRPYGQAVDGTWWDTSTIPGHLRAQLAYAGSRPGHSAALRPVAAELDAPHRQSAAAARRPWTEGGPCIPY